ncbi:hypothetical protein Smp_173040 [Schistosoma mansoni]|uniref:hypothetical protein n=1 Tax=Schistosoma mansoni TaxID=6183 RepID=UPI0001A62C40|nr:hypothetical protein Smp_173040 [Schistosoma mansoni]|eukprot:XP_018648945.1 hypothetical protein Smp_173040 [Schistosoma mansoni]
MNKVTDKCKAALGFKPRNSRESNLYTILNREMLNNLKQEQNGRFNFISETVSEESSFQRENVNTDDIPKDSHFFDERYSR